MNVTYQAMNWENARKLAKLLPPNLKTVAECRTILARTNSPIEEVAKALIANKGKLNMPKKRLNKGGSPIPIVLSNPLGLPAGDKMVAQNGQIIHTMSFELPSGVPNAANVDGTGLRAAVEFLKACGGNTLIAKDLIDLVAELRK